jgi:predicted DNA-binding protein with PD1-like motif
MMRSLRQPGVPFTPRVISLGCHAEKKRLTFKPGRSVLEAVHEALAEKGCDSAIVEVRGGAFAPLAYVAPTLSHDGLHAAWYSDIHAPNGRAPIEDLVMTFGRRDGEPFLHGHGVWRHEDGFRAAGHVMPKDSQFAEPVEAEAWILSGAIMDQLEDSETRFRLFTPVPHAAAPAITPRRAVLCRLKPNEPIHSAIERTAAEHGIERATLHGIGSLVGCTFADGQVMESAASELLIRKGTLSPDRSGQAKAKLDIAIVDTECTIFEGEIAYGVDAVCITFEVLIVEE